MAVGACAVRAGNVMLEAQPAGSRSEFALTRVACVRPADYVAMGSGGRYGFRIDSELLHGTSGR